MGKTRNNFNNELDSLKKIFNTYPKWAQDYFAPTQKSKLGFVGDLSIIQNSSKLYENWVSDLRKSILTVTLNADDVQKNQIANTLAELFLKLKDDAFIALDVDMQSKIRTVTAKVFSTDRLEKNDKETMNSEFKLMHEELKVLQDEAYNSLQKQKKNLVDSFRKLIIAYETGQSVSNTFTKSLKNYLPSELRQKYLEDLRELTSTLEIVSAGGEDNRTFDQIAFDQYKNAFNKHYNKWLQEAHRGYAQTHGGFITWLNNNLDDHHHKRLLTLSVQSFYPLKASLKDDDNLLESLSATVRTPPPPVKQEVFHDKSGRLSGRATRVELFHLDIKKSDDVKSYYNDYLTSFKVFIQAAKKQFTSLNKHRQEAALSRKRHVEFSPELLKELKFKRSPLKPLDKEEAKPLKPPKPLSFGFRRR